MRCLSVGLLEGYLIVPAEPCQRAPRKRNARTGPLPPLSTSQLAGKVITLKQSKDINECPLETREGDGQWGGMQRASSGAVMHWMRTQLSVSATNSIMESRCRRCTSIACDEVRNV